ncbi:MAG: O-antigen ligase family protein [Alphaproteobacteria bacterium]|nr:O-antigen ligase family protein [Alphaproteobacteria bacterium]
MAPWSRAAVHLCLLLALLLALREPDGALARLGTLRAPVTGALVIAGCIAAGLLPLPRAVLELVAPAHPLAAGARWGVPSQDPEATLGSLADLVSLVTMAALTALAAIRARSTRRGLGGSLLWLALGATVVIAAHELVGAQTAFGLWRPAVQNRSTFLPVVNANHVAALANLLLPLAAATAGTRRPTSRRALALATTIALLGLIVASGSRAGQATMLCSIGVLVVARWPRPAVAAAGLGAVALTLATGAALLARGGQGRRDTWEAALGALAGQPVFGVGAGAFDAAVDPFRVDTRFVRLAHVHNDPLQWMVETGLVGVGGAAVAMAVAWPRRLREADPALTGGLLLGLLAFVLQSTVDFPFRIPALALAFAAVGGGLWGTVIERGRLPVPTVRRGLAALAVLQLLAMGWRAREAVADEAAQRVEEGIQHFHVDEAARARLRRAAPWRRTLTRAALVEAPDLAAVHDLLGESPEHPDLLLTAAGVAVVEGDVAQARAWTRRAAELAPYDWRTFALGARLAGLGGRCDLQAWGDAFRRRAPPDLVVEAFGSCVDETPAAWVEALRDTRPIYLTRVLEAFHRRGVPVVLDPLLLALDDLLQGDGAFVRERAAARARAEEHDVAFDRARAPLRHRPDDARLVAVIVGLLEAHQLCARLDEVLELARTVPRLQAAALEELTRHEGATAALQLLQRWQLEGVHTEVHPAVEASLLARSGDPEACRRRLARDDLLGQEAEVCATQGPEAQTD